MAACLKIAAHSANDMFSKYSYLIVGFIFPPLYLGREFFLVAAFPDHYLLVPFNNFNISRIYEPRVNNNCCNQLLCHLKEFR